MRDTERVLTPSALTPPEEIHFRIARLQKTLMEKEIDLALILQNVDLFYFAGTIQNGYLFIPRHGEPLYFVQKDFKRAVAETPLRCVKVGSIKELPSRIQEHGLTPKKVGMEFDVVPVSLFNRVQTLFKNWEFEDLSREIKRIRSVKSEFEVRQIKRAGEIVTCVFSEVKNHLREGISEVELDARLTSVGRALGHQFFLRMRGFNQEMMNIHVLSGESASVVTYSDTPFGGPGLNGAIAQGSSAKRIRKDEPVVIDYGAGYNGYVTDETRTFVLGRLKDPFVRAYHVALDIIADLESSGRAGVIPARIYERAQQIAGHSGLSPYFMGHGEGQVAFVGHGLGLEINEWPVISKGDKRPLQSGMIFAFEPKFVFPGEGAVGIEVDFIVRQEGLERVTQFPKDIVYL
jgi:Xaa-Pro dipeptidase